MSAGSRSSRLRPALSLAAATASLAVSACGTSHDKKPPLRAPTQSAAAPVAPAVPARPDPGVVKLTALRRSLTRERRHAGHRSGVAVYDVTARRALFAAGAAVRRAPASVEKLYTTVAALRTLGPDATLRTQVLGSGHLGKGGVWHGRLYLKGGGDPTFGDASFNATYLQGYGPTGRELAARVHAAGIRRVTGGVVGDESLFDERRGGLITAYAPDLLDFGGQLGALTYNHGSTSKRRVDTPAAFAARKFAAALKHVHVHAGAARHPGTAPAGAQRLASVASPPLRTLIRLMNLSSDDLIAELLTKQLGVHAGAAGTIHAGAKAIGAAVAGDYGLHPKILDGSGLARGDRSSPQQVVELLRRLWHTPTGKILSGSLPVMGVSGTARHLGLQTAAAHRCRAKTGSLNGVTNLAGYCHTRGGHVAAFALFVDGPANGVAFELEAKMAAAIARY